jgi:hypothetical protein
MSIELVLYKVEYHDGTIKTLDKRALKETIADIIHDVSSIVKTYRYNNKLHRLTLFSVEHDFTADEYIDHYKSLHPDKYGKHFFSEFDESVIRKLNY